MSDENGMKPLPFKSSWLLAILGAILVLGRLLVTSPGWLDAAFALGSLGFCLFTLGYFFRYFLRRGNNPFTDSRRWW
jgi:hypothetical protein